MKWRRVFLVAALLGLLCPVGASAFPAPFEPVHYSDSFLAHYFDLNKDGALSRYEWGLMMTQVKMGYRVITNKKMIPFDIDGDHMLEPVEWENYLKSKQDKRTDLKL